MCCIIIVDSSFKLIKILKKIGLFNSYGNYRQFVPEYKDRKKIRQILRVLCYEEELFYVDVRKALQRRRNIMNKLRTRPDFLIALLIALIALFLVATMIISQLPKLPYIPNY